MQLTDVIKSISKYRALIVLLILNDTAKNSTDTVTSIGIGASLHLTNNAFQREMTFVLQ